MPSSGTRFPAVRNRTNTPRTLIKPRPGERTSSTSSSALKYTSPGAGSLPHCSPPTTPHQPTAETGVDMLFGIDGNVLQLEEGQGLFHNSSAGAPAAAIFRTLGGVVSVSMDKKTLNYNTSTTILSLNIEKTPTLAGEIARLLIKVADVAMVLELSFPERDEIIEAIWNDENPHITLDNLQTLENILTGLEKRRVGSPYILLHNALILNSGNASTNGTGSLAIDKLIFSYLARAIFNWSKQRITATLRFAGARFSLEVNKDDNDPNGVKLTITDQSKNQSRDFSFTDSPTKFAELFEQAMLDE